MRRYVSLSLILLALIGIDCKSQNPLTAPELDYNKHLALVVNGLSETLSIVQFEQDTVITHAAELGAWCQDITLSPDGKTAYIVNSGDNNVQVLSLTDLKTLEWLDIGIGTNPYNLELSGAGLLYVTCFLTNGLTVVDLSSSSTIATIPVGQCPEGLAIDGNRAYVTNTAYAYGDFGQGTVSIVDLDSMAVIRTVSVPTNPQDAVIDSEGFLHVVCTGDYLDESGVVVVVNLDSGMILDTIPVGGFPSAICLAPNGIAYVSGYWGGLMSYNISSRELLHSSSNPLLDREGLMGLDVDSETSALYLCDFDDDLLLVVCLSDGELIAEYPVGDGPISVVIRTKTMIPLNDPIFVERL